eukprot:CAMPEP_0184304404 /NCGR_PEP_ID=MMETSP1049-20130417/13927_1 /TAXON_ID=77928 /ORGANISM="Proteomonas sulcata, Strain CCMP704" /LENGTH=57 /DNA_ID=CAMNT_0026616201 /DNA_START=409 /DNA_END=582 /DNA_ORIENTATION=-
MGLTTSYLLTGLSDLRLALEDLCVPGLLDIPVLVSRLLDPVGGGLRVAGGRTMEPDA